MSQCFAKSFQLVLTVQGTFSSGLDLSNWIVKNQSSFFVCHSAVMFSFSRPFWFQYLLYGQAEIIVIWIGCEYLTLTLIDILDWILPHYHILEDSLQLQEQQLLD